MSRWINGRAPRQYGLDFVLWTRAVLAEPVRKEFGLTLGLTTVGELLTRSEPTPRKPLPRTDPRDPAAMEKWQRETGPAITGPAKAQAAEIFARDASRFRADTVYGKARGIHGPDTGYAAPGPASDHPRRWRVLVPPP